MLKEILKIYEKCVNIFGLIDRTHPAARFRFMHADT